MPGDSGTVWGLDVFVGGILEDEPVEEPEPDGVGGEYVTVISGVVGPGSSVKL